ncbi:hypothetical protein [Cellulomonas sp. S1-8]|uniref:hypothetical protein n=1 Tax=Cellulomonas sp. S1-8 TaxID=2904790 RepID=UPI002244B054|nr:hypothetical protein [Cellulomonas sp. S1-8]UZN04802.1 hypothetical protein OKX07_07845 [Cellulomonas sp. S1-8]
MEYHQLSSDLAARFCEHVAAREPYMLRELASWMKVTGGPLDAMDASVDSLDELWQWYWDLALADFRGLTDGMAASAFVLPAGEPAEESDALRLQDRLRSEIGADRLVHYVRLVLDRIAPGTYWGVYDAGMIDNLHQQPAVFLPGWPGTRRHKDGCDVFFGRTGGLVSFHQKHKPFDPGWLHRIALVDAPQGFVPEHQDRGPSVLRPYLDLDLPPMPDIARTSPLLQWFQNPSPPPTPERRWAPGEDVWEDMILAKGNALGLEDEPWLLTPLPADRVAAALVAGGFEDVTASVLLTGEELDHPEQVARVMTIVHDGALRALHIEAANPTPASWRRLITPLRTLATELDANLVPEGEYPGAGEYESED